MLNLFTTTVADSTLKPAPSVNDIYHAFVKWIYYNLCGFGIQIQRTFRRYVRRTKRLLRPVGKFALTQYERVKQPLISAGKTLGVIGTDTKRVLTAAGATAKSRGVKAAQWSRSWWVRPVMGRRASLVTSFHRASTLNSVTEGFPSGRISRSRLGSGLRAMGRSMVPPFSSGPPKTRA